MIQGLRDGRDGIPVGLLGGLWLLASAALVCSGWTEITTLSGWDPDDQLRLVQLRDFLGGQGWFDTTQYRMNSPAGAPMHWSRLIELPLAGLVLLLRPLFGQPVAEMTAGTAVPLLLLGWITFMLSQIAARISSREASVAAALITLSSGALLLQLRPIRIDHHGWQLAMAVLALSTLFWADVRKAGGVLGLALAVWLHISLEGAPMTAAFFLLLGLRWVRDAYEGQRLLWTVGSFAGASLLLFLGTQSGGVFAQIYCDTLSPPHIWAVLFATALIVPAIRFLPDDWRFRAAVAGIAGIGALAVIFTLAPTCLGGAFGGLDPLVRDYWYSKISEGLPIWHQPWRTALALASGLLCGAISWLMLMRMSKGADYERLRTLGFFLLFGLLLSIAVVRTISVATAFAIPVAAALIALLFKRYRQSKVALQRVGLVVLMLALLVPGAVVSLVLQALPAEAEQKERSVTTAKNQCQSARSVAALSSLPDAVLLAPFDMGPMILVQTPHKVLASSHHRNEQAMRDHIQIFRLPPERSRIVIERRGITHIVACNGEAELEFYLRKDRAGLWAQIQSEDVPAWLEPLPDVGEGIKVWRVH